MKVVVAHDFAETYGGAERIIAAALAVLPDAELWTIAGRESVAGRMGVPPERFHSLLGEGGITMRHYRKLAPIYPTLARRRALPEADVLLTSSYAFAHGFRTRNRAPQVCYCYSPLRFLWSMTEDYERRVAPGPVRRAAFRAVVAAMRRSDRRSAERVDTYVSESRHVADVVRRAYGRDSEVVYPPVDCDLFRPDPAGGHDGYHLFCGRLVEPYKKPGIVVEAFRSLPGERLVIAGDGPAYAELKRNAGPNVEFIGHLDDADLVPLMQRCAVTVFPSVDDFGLIPVEVMACGRPVLAFAGGGALETVAAGRTGEFFGEQSAATLVDALRAFDPEGYDPAAIRAHAEAWETPRFQRGILAQLERAVA